MDEYQGLAALIESAWKEVDASCADRRDSCLDAVSDVLETGRLTQDDAERVIERLVTIALSDEGHAVRESALHAICSASTHHELPYRVVEPLAVGAAGFEPLLLDYVLSILGSTHDQAALPIVERFLQHPHLDVRREAADAVHELSWSRESSVMDDESSGERGS
ncbi:HEAT repeat domain-containing protein [Streptomyces sp. NPDC056527]|uniref:HEAT repeat domain-containing protein n=1 Tax=Streptomyces sp. NPDC056527 TaxID=3345853 RepID=UPI0036BF9A3A